MRTIELCSEKATAQYVIDCIKSGRPFEVIGRTKVIIK